MMTEAEVATAYEWETGNVIVERFRNIDPADMSAVLVHSHAPFVWGPSGRKAVEIAYALEIVAEMAMKTLALNPDVQAVPQYLLDKHYKRKHGPGAYYGQRQG
jgi:L-ribulose-5-phosphate 4-epimerase